jgi:hypothetical protein
MNPAGELVLLRLRAPPPESRAARCWPPPASAAAPCLPAPRRVIAGVDWGPSGYEIFRRDSGAWLLTRRSLTTVCGGVRAVQEEQAGRAYPIARRRLVVVMAAWWGRRHVKLPRQFFTVLVLPVLGVWWGTRRLGVWACCSLQPAGFFDHPGFLPFERDEGARRGRPNGSESLSPGFHVVRCGRGFVR